MLILAAFGPLSEATNTALMVLGSAGMLVWVLADSPESRREIGAILIALATLVPLALLVSINPKWLIFGAIGVYIGIPIWEMARHEHDEYLAERERLP